MLHLETKFIFKLKRTQDQKHNVKKFPFSMKQHGGAMDGIITTQ